MCLLGNLRYRIPEPTAWARGTNKWRSIRSHPTKPRRPRTSARGSEAYAQWAKTGILWAQRQQRQLLHSDFSNLRQRPANRALLWSQFSCWVWRRGRTYSFSCLRGCWGPWYPSFLLMLVLLCHCFVSSRWRCLINLTRLLRCWTLSDPCFLLPR